LQQLFIQTNGINTFKIASFGFLAITYIPTYLKQKNNTKFKGKFALTHGDSQCAITGKLVLVYLLIIVFDY